MAPMPQEPGHGSRHFSLMQAKLLEQSELTVHSGRQFGGLPINVDKQEHDGTFPTLLHSALGPQGDGTHGFTTSTCTGCGGGSIII